MHGGATALVGADDLGGALAPSRIDARGRRAAACARRSARCRAATAPRRTGRPSRARPPPRAGARTSGCSRLAPLHAPRAWHPPDVQPRRSCPARPPVALEQGPRAAPESIDSSARRPPPRRVPGQAARRRWRRRHSSPPSSAPCPARPRRTERSTAAFSAGSPAPTARVIRRLHPEVDGMYLVGVEVRRRSARPRGSARPRENSSSPSALDTTSALSVPSAMSAAAIVLDAPASETPITWRVAPAGLVSGPGG